MEPAFCYLQPVMRADPTFLSINTLNLESAREVESDEETSFYRNKVLAGHAMRWGVRVSWTHQISLWLIKNTTSAGHWARRKHRNHGDVNTHKQTVHL